LDRGSQLQKPRGGWSGCHSALITAKSLATRLMKGCAAVSRRLLLHYYMFLLAFIHFILRFLIKCFVSQHACHRGYHRACDVSSLFDVSFRASAAGVHLLRTARARYENRPTVTLFLPHNLIVNDTSTAVVLFAVPNHKPLVYMYAMNTFNLYAQRSTRRDV